MKTNYIVFIIIILALTVIVSTQIIEKTNFKEKIEKGFSKKVSYSPGDIHCETGSTDSLEQNGITLTFDREVQCGKFANGDYWVIGPVTITSINPQPIFDIDERPSESCSTSDDCTNPPSPINGNEYEKICSSSHCVYALIRNKYTSPSSDSFNQESLDSRHFEKFSQLQHPLIPLENLNNQIIIFTISNPQKNECSLGWYTMSENNAYRKCSRSVIKTAIPLTILSTPPQQNSLRPGWAMKNPQILFTKDDIDFSKINSIQLSTENIQNIPSYNDIIEGLQNIWLETNQAIWIARYFHPTQNIPGDYGAEMSSFLGDAFSRLLLNDLTQEQKENVTLKLVQLGIDLYTYATEHDVNWEADGGHNSGRKLPILFAGELLNNQQMINFVKNSQDNQFAEDCQTFYSPENPPFSLYNCYPTLSQQYQNSNGEYAWYGLRHCQFPDDPHWHGETPGYDAKTCDNSQGNYFNTNPSSWIGEALVIHILKIESDWNHNAFLEFMDRYMDTSREGAYINNFLETMWDTYRNKCTTDSDCDDNNPCTDDFCNIGTCENTPDDTNTCTINGECNSGNSYCSNGECIDTPDSNLCSNPLNCQTVECSEDFQCIYSGCDCQTATDSWQSFSFEKQNNIFTAEFDALSHGQNIDGVIGFSRDTATQYSDLAAILRFNITGQFDARNFSQYQSEETLDYSQTPYHFKIKINIPQKKYDIKLTSENKQIARQYLFREEQSDISEMNNYSIIDSTNQGFEICNFQITQQCGNGIIEEGEICDDNSQPCTTEEGNAGMQNCLDNCSDWGACITIPECGNGILENGEECEPEISPTRSCTTDEGYSGIQACLSDCTWGDCTSQERCGDNILNGNEQCDGSNLNGETCESQGFNSGEISCNTDCTLNTAFCKVCSIENAHWQPTFAPENSQVQLIIERNNCGGEDINFTIKYLSDNEEKSIDSFLSKSNTPIWTVKFPQEENPSEYYFEAYPLSNPSNKITNTPPNLTLLSLSSTCGNGIIDENEQCDGENLGEETCESQGFPNGGTLKCSSCLFDFSLCSQLPNATSFDGETTQFSTEPDITQVQNAIIEKSSFGKIYFPETINFERLNLNKNIIIEQNKIGIKTSEPRMTELNNTANITFYNINIPLENLIILKDKEKFENYKLTSYQDNNLEIQVPSFSTYEVTDHYCGDGTCNSDESCSSCQQDCGTCQENNGGSGDSGDSGNNGNSGSRGDSGDNSGNTENNTPSSNQTYECSDNIDNDNDSLIDFPNDPGCESYEDNSESENICAPRWECNSWSSCKDGKKSRTCTDKNNCTTETQTEEKDCTIDKQTLIKFAEILLSIIIAILSILAIIFLIKKYKNNKFSPPKLPTSKIRIKQ